MKESHVAIFATKELLHYTCLKSITTLVDAEDNRRVIAYVVTPSDWARVEEWYADRGDIVILKRHRDSRPVLAATPSLLLEAGNLIR